MVRLKKIDKRLIAGALVLVAGAALYLLIWHNPPKTAVIPSTNAASVTTQTSTADSVASQSAIPNSVSTNAGDKSSSVDVPAGSAPAAPTGNFISNHRPSVSTSLQESSVCVSTPGATCYIQFSQGDMTRTLAEQKTDSAGSTYWNWNVSEAQLTNGSWKVQAIAKLNGQTATSSDPMNLEVQL